MQVNICNTGLDFAVLMPAKQHFTEDINHGASMGYSQKTCWGHHEILCAQRTERAFAPFPSPWSWAPHSCSVLMTFAPAFHGLADTHMPHCCSLLDKKQPDCDCLNYSSVPGVSQGRAAPRSLANAEQEGDATESRVQASESIGAICQ